MSYFWGYLSDTQGRRRTLLIGLWGGFVASTVSAFSTHWYMLAALKIIVPGYFILNMGFRYEWGLISFTPWRLLSLVVTAPLGLSALMLHCFCESPKFLLNAGRKAEALECLGTIWRRNGYSVSYPILPLFKPPLLWRTLQLFYLTAVIYAMPGLWTRPALREPRTLFSGIIHGVMFFTITLGISKLAHRKKALMIAFFLIPLLSTLGAVYNENNVASLVLFVGMMMTNMCMGVLFSYYVDLYPTSYRGMAACLGVMMSRLSGLAGVHFVGALICT
ncbi:putative SV2-like protein 1 [Operophtera brumata]|uniref:Putative SV2-like protein 1 n=1 Tax=Operophtera brumata TaxID=104452 RepID=A0A0L7KV69_OPEBR|nr:putative SV2-like protein 1 [Operophtera brumata]